MHSNHILHQKLSIYHHIILHNNKPLQNMLITPWNQFFYFDLPRSFTAPRCPYFFSSQTLKYFMSVYNYQLPFNQYFKISWFRFVLFAGLGYKRKIFAKKRIMFSYIADRHWIMYKFSPFSIIYPARRRNFIFLSKKKNDFVSDYSFFSSMRTPYVYKMKGFLDYRVKRRFIFIRRLKLKRIKTKLSKKQQML